MSLEKHLTYDKHAQGPDHAASLTATEMAEYVSYARRAHNAKQHLIDVHPPADLFRFLTGAEKKSAAGSTFERVKRVLPAEEDVRRVSRQSLTTTRALSLGHTLTRDDLTIKRPGTGMPPHMLDQVIGRELRTHVEADMPLMESDI